MILVFGKTGQVAQELALLPGARCVGRDEADLAVAGASSALIETVRPDAVINAAAYTAVDKAESEEDVSRRVNGQAPGEMARACAALGVPLVQISTDYVFNGTGEAAWKPDDRVDAQNAYGRSKLVGEVAVRDTGGVHAILRTSWVFSAHGANFVKTMLRLGAERDRLTIVADQIGGPTSARAIARACHGITEQLVRDPNKAGTYHFSGGPDCSWADFARAIFAEAGLDCEVVDIPTSNYPTPAKRPLNSRLDCTATEEVFGIKRPHWRNDLRGVLKDLGALA